MLTPQHCPQQALTENVLRQRAPDAFGLLRVCLPMGNVQASQGDLSQAGQLLHRFFNDQ